MTVAELIKELQDLCEDRDPTTVEVKKVEDCPTFGADYVRFLAGYGRRQCISFRNFGEIK